LIEGAKGNEKGKGDPSPSGGVIEGRSHFCGNDGGGGGGTEKPSMRKGKVPRGKP